MGVDHRCDHTGMPEKFLNRAYVAAALEQVSGETVPKHVRRCRVGNAGLSQGPLASPSEGLVEQMVAVNYATARIGGQGRLLAARPPGGMAFGRSADSDPCDRRLRALCSLKPVIDAVYTQS